MREIARKAAGPGDRQHGMPHPRQPASLMPAHARPSSSPAHATSKLHHSTPGQPMPQLSRSQHRTCRRLLCRAAQQRPQLGRGDVGIRSRHKIQHAPSQPLAQRCRQRLHLLAPSKLRVGWVRGGRVGLGGMWHGERGQPANENGRCNHGKPLGGPGSRSHHATAQATGLRSRCPLDTQLPRPAPPRRTCSAGHTCW